MEDFLKFVLVAAVLIGAFVRQTRKEAQKKASQRPAVPRREKPATPPSPRQEDRTYGGYIPEGPAPKPATPTRPRTVLPAEGQRTTSAPRPATPPPATGPEKDAAGDFRLHSAEEVRRAIIWGEILQRKY